MNEDRLLDLVASLRGGGGSWASPGEALHPDRLTFQRAYELAGNPELQTEQERRHLAQCRRCANLVKNFQQQLKAPGRLGTFVKAMLKPLAAVFLAAAPPLVNWLVSSYFTNPSISPLDWWESAQQQFVRNGIGLFVVLTLLAPVLYWFGWIRRATLSVPLLMLTFLAVSVGVWAVAQQQQARISHRLHAIFLEHRWIAYDPPGYDPYKGIMPSVDELERDLRRLRSEKEGGGGFDGLITFSAKGTLGEIPRIAKKCGFRAVIMGISIDRANPVKPEEQMQKAVEVREWVDGYCLGHNPPMSLSFETLGAWMAELRQATGNPVTTTAPLVSYLGDHGKPLRDLGDWYFPDCPGFWHLGATPQDIFREARQAVILATELPRNRPVLLKMISFPADGAPGLSQEAQAEFFTAVCRDLYLPPGVYVSFYSAYDLPWMSHEAHPNDWSRPQRYVGLFTSDGRPRPAVAVVRKGFPVQSRP